MDQGQPVPQKKDASTPDERAIEKELDKQDEMKKALEEELGRELTPQKLDEALKKAHERQGSDPFSSDN
ncbi:MAG: hypothetical protein Q8O83_01870 [bacterium]|nr:hypothetical protein [bacterium]